MEEDGEEAECGEGPSAPALLQGDDFADAEGYDVTEAPATNGENHISYILNSGDDEFFVSGVSRRAPTRFALPTSSDGRRESPV